MAFGDIIFPLVSVAVAALAVVGGAFALRWMEGRGAAAAAEEEGADQIFAGHPLAALAPLVALMAAVATIALLPFTGGMTIGGSTFALQVMGCPAGVAAILAMSALGIFALLGWMAAAEGSRFGRSRSAERMAAGEIAKGFAVIAVVIVAGALSLQEIIRDQGPRPWSWNAVRQPLAFALFVAALMLEAWWRSPSLPEEEVHRAGEGCQALSDARPARRSMAGFARDAAGAAVAAALFLGGWQIPFAPAAEVQRRAPEIVATLWPLAGVALLVGGACLVRARRCKGRGRGRAAGIAGFAMALSGAAVVQLFVLQGERPLPGWMIPFALAAMQLAVFLVKAAAVGVFLVWGRARLRLMRRSQGCPIDLGWKVLVPLGLVNMVATAAAVTMR